MARVDQAVGEQRDDPFDAAVAGRRDREPDRAEQADPQRRSSDFLDRHPAVLEADVPGLAERAHARKLERPDPGRQLLGRAATRARAGARSGSSPSSSCSSSTGVPAAQACGRRGGRVGDRERRLGAREAGEDLGQLVLEVARSRRTCACTIRCASAPAAAAREAPGDQRVVVRPDGAVVVLERVEAARPPGTSSARPSPTRAPRPSAASTTASTRSGGTIPLQSRWPMFEQSESTGSLVRVERERVVAAAPVDPERLVEACLAARPPPARAARRARGRARPRAPARPCGASRRRRSPGPRPGRSAARRASRRRTSASRRSPSTTGSRARGSSGAGTRRSRRRRGRRSARSTRALAAPARAGR